MSTTNNPCAVNIAGIRKQAHEIEIQVGDIGILLKAIHDQLDYLSDLPPAALEAVNAIACFANCAQRVMVAVEQAGASIIKLTHEGGAA